jgi:hypothetical protein
MFGNFVQRNMVIKQLLVDYRRDTVIGENTGDIFQTYQSQSALMGEFLRIG